MQLLEALQVARIPETFNIGDRTDISPERLLLLLERMYMDLAEAVNSKPEFVERATDGQVTDTFLPQGTLNLNSATLKVEMLVQHNSPTSVTWKTL